MNTGIIIKRIAMILSAAFFACAFSGCSGLKVIREDPVREDYQEIDPEAGASSEVAVTLYARMGSEEYLVPLSDSVTVISSMRAEKRIVEALLEEDAGIMPESTELEDVMLDGDILYVTLSGAFVATDTVDEEADRLAALLNDGKISQDDYYVGIIVATSEMYTVRRLAASAIINSVTAYNPDIVVQILIDSDGNGVGERLRRSELGFKRISSGDAELIEPMGFIDSAVATPAITLDCALKRIAAMEYDKAYPLFDAPDAADAETFAKLLSARGTISKYAIADAADDETGTTVIYIDITALDPGGNAREAKNAGIALTEKDGAYRVALDGFIDAVWGEQ